MCTFADLMSLLLCFFVLLLSFSVMDAQKYKMVQGSMKNAFGVQKQEKFTQNPAGEKIIAPSFLSTPLAVKIMARIDEEIAEELNAGLIEVEEAGQNSVLLRVKDSVAFEFGKAELRPQFLIILDKIGKIIREIEAKATVSGHTDNVPLKRGGPFSSNWSLSTARSVAVVEYWAEKYNIPSQRLTAIGFAEGQPLASNGTPEGRAANRRVEFKIALTQTALTFKGLKGIIGE